MIPNPSLTSQGHPGSLPRNPAVVAPGSTTSIIGRFCGHCGKPHGCKTLDGGGAPPSDVQQECRLQEACGAHQACAARLQLEPPRYCARCGRRLKVQVSPSAWRATCSRHGTTTS